MDSDAYYDPYRGVTETYALMECDQCKAETEHLMRKQWGAWSGVCGDCGNELELDDEDDDY